MKIIASIVFSAILAAFAVMANKDRHQDEADQLATELAKENARDDARSFAAGIQVERIKNIIQIREESARESTDPVQLALALENLRESRAELRRYQSLAR